MTQRILITALFDRDLNLGQSYYIAQGLREKLLYCDGVFPTEANCKYLLSSYPIDEILVFGIEETGQKEDEKPATLRQKKKTLPSDMKNASGFHILVDRLIKFLDDYNGAVEEDSLLSIDEQEKAKAFVQDYFREKVERGGEKKYSRFFDYLVNEKGIRDAFEAALTSWLPDPKNDLERYRNWILSFLYRELKATSKLEPLDANENTRIRYFQVKDFDILSLLDFMVPIIRGGEGGKDVPDVTEFYVCVEEGQGASILDLINAMNLTKIMPSRDCRIARVITEMQIEKYPFFVYRDLTDDYTISELLAATGAFLSYGKTDLLVNYWERARLYNPKIEKILYAMRNIDYGISVCDIGDLERGIKSLREAIQNDPPVSGDTTIEKYFGLAIESIRSDYGSLLEGEEIPFIDLVKWAYRKGFLQQTLTIIESRAAGDFVDRGIFFYSDGEKSRKLAIECLGQTYYDMKPFEKYQMNDISHYYIKYYSRRKAPRTTGESYEMAYAAIRMEELDTHDEKLIRAHTICPDRTALQNLLFAYYHLGSVRNQTNHAAENFGGFYDIMADSDPSEREKIIKQAIDYFIYCYDKVDDLIRGKKATVVKIDSSDLESYTRMLRNKYRSDRNNTSDNNRKSGEGKKE